MRETELRRSRGPRQLGAVVCVALLMAVVVPYNGSAGESDGIVPMLDEVVAASPVDAALAASTRSFASADTVVLARDDRAGDALVGAPYAAQLGGPLLLTPDHVLPTEVIDEIHRLGATRVMILGGPAAVSPEVEAAATELMDRAEGLVDRIAGPDRFSTAVAVAEQMDSSDGLVVTIAEVTPDSVTAAALAASRGVPVLPVETDAVAPVSAAFLARTNPAVVSIVGGTAVVSAETELSLAAAAGSATERFGGMDRYGTAVQVADALRARAASDDPAVWLLSGTGPEAVAAAVAAGHEDGVSLLIEGQRLERSRVSAEWLIDTAVDGTNVVVFGVTGTIAADLSTQVERLFNGPMLPGGGRFLFPDHRIIAPYGSHFAPGLGPLGEQPPEDVGVALDRVLSGYAEDEQTIPGFDLITTLATREAGDGTYRKRSRPGEIQAWLDAAREHDAYLILDIQPGRADVLTEVMAYEEFLREPDVGLAIDIEWISRPPRRPGDRTVGHMFASEINEVAAYLSDLVVAEGIPEKLLLLHAFVPNQIRDPDDIAVYDGVAILMHMDGLGTPGGKRLRYRQLALPPPFYNGFKVFYDLDDPVMSPEAVSALDPYPLVITYQ